MSRTKDLLTKIRSNKALIIALLVLVLSFVGLIVSFVVLHFRRAQLDELRSDEALMEQLQTIPGAVAVKRVARVGNEFIFESDVHKYGHIRGQYIHEVDREAAIEDLIFQSVVLQAAVNNGWISWDRDVFNNPFKDYDRRFELINEVLRNFSTYENSKYDSMKDMTDEFRQYNIIEIYDED